MPAPVPNEIDVAVVGAGPAGLTAAIALALGGVPTALLARPPEQTDNRTTALLSGSVMALIQLGVWERCAAHAEALDGIRLIDDTGRLIRGPEVLFESSEIGLKTFGANIENRHLVAALQARAAELPNLVLIPQSVRAVSLAEDRVGLTLDDRREMSARLIVGADGRRSLCRGAAGIETRHTEYPQTALTVNVTHTRPHDRISTEFHTPDGPFTLVPLPGLRSSLVCVVRPRVAKQLVALDDAALSREIERRSHSILGRITVDGPRGLFRLGSEAAERFAAHRVALVGEAAHVFPPIGAQGLNLGLRDAATIAELAIAAHRQARDVGGATLLAEYDRLRRADVTTRTAAVDLLNRTLLSDFLPIQAARGLGLYLLERIAPLRRAVMSEGVAPRLSEPRLMRGEMI